MGKIKDFLDSFSGTQVWKSIVRHGIPRTDRNRALAVLSNVFLHLHPIKVRKSGIKLQYTWCMGGVTFFLFLLETFTGLLLMFYYWPTVDYAYVDIIDLADLVHAGDDARFFLLAGKVVGAGALLRFYVLHCVAIPIVAGTLMAVHFWRVRKDGGISGPL